MSSRNLNKEQKAALQKLMDEGRFKEYTAALKSMSGIGRQKSGWHNKPYGQMTKVEKRARNLMSTNQNFKGKPEEAYKESLRLEKKSISGSAFASSEEKEELISRLPEKPSAPVVNNADATPAANLDKYSYEGNGVYRKKGTNDFYDAAGGPLSQQEAEDRITGKPLQKQEEGEAAPSPTPAAAQKRRDTNKSAIKKYLKNAQSLLFNRAQRFEGEEFEAKGHEKIYKLESGSAKNTFSQRLSTESVFSKNPRNKGQSVGDFLNATPAQLACLMPLLRFYIVDSEGNSREIYFSDKVSEAHLKSIAELKGASDIQKVLTPRKGSGGEAGIKSFTWNYNNKHEGDYVIEAELELYFSTLVELANVEYLQFLFPTGNATEIADELDNTSSRQKTIEEGRNKNVSNSRNRQSEINKLEPRINQYRRILEQGNAQLHHLDSKNNKQMEADRKKNFRQLKVVVGWSLPEGNQAQLAQITPGDSLASFLEDIKRTQTAIHLNLYDYNVNFSQEGPTTLSLKYLGSSDNYMATESSDIFGSNNFSSKVLYKNTKVSLEGIISENGKLSDKTPPTGQGRKASGINPHLVNDPYLNKQIEITGVKPDQYGERYVNVQLAGLRFAQELVRLEMKLAEAQNAAPKSSQVKGLKLRGAYITLLYNRALNTRLRDMYSNFLEMMIDSDIIKKALVEIGPDKKVKLSVGRQVKLRQQERVEARQQLAKQQEDGGGSSSWENNVRTSSIQDQIDRGKLDTSFALYYAFLGDILKVAMKNADLRSDITLLLGEYEDINDVNRSIYNLPITLDSFGQFFYNRVVSTRMTAYPFRTFLNDFLNYTARLVNANPQTSERLSFEYTVMPSTYRNIQGRPKERKPKTLSGGDYVGIREGMLNPLAKKNKKYQSYYPIFSKKMSFGDRKGNRIQDMNDGIFHYAVGSDRGLAKKFNFSRQETAYYQEMLIESNNPSDQIQALFLPQNVEIEMYGNGIHRNGDLIYVDTRAALGEFAGKILGIGGYYRVVRCTHQITNRGYVTNLTCVFELRTK